MKSTEELKKDPVNLQETYEEVMDHHKEMVQEWIFKNLEHASKNCHGGTSYGIKHEFEKDTGVYLTNGHFKGAMLVAGFDPIDYDELNWEFKIKRKKKIISNINPYDPNLTSSDKSKIIDECIRNPIYLVEEVIGKKLLVHEKEMFERLLKRK